MLKKLVEPRKPKLVRSDTLAKDIAKVFTGKAMARIVRGIDSEDEKVAMAASQWIVERAEGKAAATVTGKIDVNHNVQLHLDALRAMAGQVIEGEVMRDEGDIIN